MDRNFILALLLSIIIIISFQFYYQSVAPPPPKKPATTTEASKETGPQKAAPEPAPRVEKAPQPVPEPKVSQPLVPTETAAAEVRTVVDTPKYEAILTSNGAKIVSFRLKDYTTQINGSDLEDLFQAEGRDTSGPSVMFTRRDETFNDAGLNYHTDAKPSIKITGTGKTSVTYEATTAAGLTIAKTYTFDSETYDVGFSLALTNNSSEDRNYLITFPWRKFYPGEEGQRFAWNSAEILLDGVLKDYYFKDIKGDEEPSGQVEWAGLGDVYFFKALVFNKKPAAKVTLFKPSNDKIAEIWVRYGGVDLPPGKPVTTDLKLYMGPKLQEALETAGDNLPRALIYSNYRILDLMSKYLVEFLKFCHNGFTVAGVTVPGTGNYGWDIIILTIFIKILFIPLTHKSMKSMKRMQEIQPQLQKIKEKFKDDKAAINKATMELFREQKVSPLGGCWPMFLQLPVFIALYQALSYAIELRHAHFVCIPSIFLCINDLSAPDPYYVTPVLMGGTMVLQQWMTPSGGDPMQKKMMLLMPVVFTYMFLSFPSGLVLYWLVSNVLSIGQQIITNRMAD